MRPSHKPDVNSTAPQCISARHLQVFRGKRFEFSGSLCKVLKGVWKPNNSSSYDVAIKVLKKESEEKKMKVNMIN